VAARLDWAADYIDKHGWCRNTFVDGRGRVCAIGGIQGSTPGNPDGTYSRVSSDATYAVEELLEAEKGDYIGLEMFNDEIAKDKRYVTRLLRRAARLIRQRKLVRRTVTEDGYWPTFEPSFHDEWALASSTKEGK
jgi:hypothetical protein